MAEIQLTNGFENAVLIDNVPDRTYNAEDVNTRFQGLVSSYGVYSNIGNACQVVADSGLNIIVKNGKGEVNNHYFKIEADTQLTLDAADVILNRIDSIVIRRINSERKIILTIKKGELASEPIAPAIERTEDIQEIYLASIRINAGATTITNSNITDLRPSNNYCGFIACLVEQLNTEELFKQYQDAQETFLTTQTQEIETFISTEQNNFDTWFESIKNTVKANSLYREYEQLYNSAALNEQVITIPSSINYVHDGLDVLSVYINGNRLVKNTEYTINSTGTQITLTNPLGIIGTRVVFINKKSLDDSVAESVVVQVENLQNKIDSLQDFSYTATGNDDNIILSNKVKSFLDGTGDYSGVADNASLKISVNGELGISSLIENQMMFDFNSSVASNRKVIVDFGNSTIPNAPIVTTTILAVISAINNVVIENANIKIGDYNTGTIYGFHGGVIKNSKLVIENSNSNVTTIYGGYDCDEISNSYISINNSNNTYACYAVYRVQFNTINAYGNGTVNSIKSTDGFVIGNVIHGVTSISGEVQNIANIIQ